jgi:hypothetical protein
MAVAKASDRAMHTNTATAKTSHICAGCATGTAKIPAITIANTTKLAKTI